MSGVAPIGGVWAAVITPFDDRRAVDTDALDHVIDYLRARDIAGIAVLTEAAEDVLLTAGERKGIVKQVGRRLKGKLPFMVYISTPSSPDAIELARISEAKGAGCIVLSPARLPGIGYRELYRHLDRIVRAVTLPVMVLARPHNALESLEPEELETLFKHDGVAGVVAPHATPAEVERWVKRFKGRDAGVLTGCSLSNAKAMESGSVGAVCGLVQIAAELSAELQAAISRGDTKATARLEGRLAPAIEILGPTLESAPVDGVQKLATKIARRSLRSPAVALSYPAPLLKAILKIEGHPIRPEVRAPYERARPDQIEKLKAILQRTGILS